VACKVWRVSLECKVWSVKCGVQSAQCRGKLKGPPSAPEWTFGSVGRSNAASGESSGRQVDVRTQHDNGARPRFHTASSVKKAKLWGSNVKCKV
jgi:hypothetical protein